MFTIAEVAFWSAEDTLERFRTSIPLGWKLTVWKDDSGYSAAELHDDQGERVWGSSNFHAKLLYLEGLGWLMVRDHKTTHPMWRPREREVELRVPNPRSSDPDPPDLDPAEVDAVYRSKCEPPGD